MTKYKVVRTYDDGKTKEQFLQDAFNDGYKFVRASEYIPEATHNQNRRYGYIEYILRKEVAND